jgi:PAS domain S-box-containing protein
MLPEAVETPMGYVTVRKRPASSPVWSRETFHQLVANAPEPVVVIDETRRIVLFNLAAEELFGYSAGEVLSQPLDILTSAPPTDSDLEAGRFDVFGVHRRGHTIPLNVGVSRIHVGGTTLSTCILRTISDALQTQAALRESQERFRLVFEAAAIGFAIVELDGRFRAANRSLCDMLGYTEAELLGLNFRDLTYPEDLKRDLVLSDRLLAGEIDSYRLEKRFLHEQGHSVWVLIAVSLVRDSKGAPQYFVSQGTDVSIQKEAEHALARRATELERSNAELEQFAYVASHDLRQPLRTVASYAELLAERYSSRLDERAERWITYVIGGVDRMQRLIDDLLALARVHTHAGAFVQTDTAALVLRTWDQVRHEYPSEARLEHRNLPLIVADTGQLEQLFQNLFDNALKYSRAGIPLEVQVSAQPIGREPGLWEFTVQDNGIGLDMTYAERIFEIFQRLHQSDEYEGTGIGLAMCKRIVERHGGQIRVDSVLGEGTSFRFTLLERGAA